MSRSWRIKQVSIKLNCPLNPDTRLDLQLDPISLFSSFSTLLTSFSTLWPFSFAPFSALFFPLHSPHVFLQTTVHHLEGSLDAGGPPHLPSSTLFGHNVCYFSLLLPHACFLVNTVNNGWTMMNNDGNLFSATVNSILISDRTSSAEPSSPSPRCPRCSRQPRLSSWPAPSSSTSGNHQIPTLRCSACCNICQDSLLSSPPNDLTLRFFLALASATRLMGRALISFHFSLYSSTISRVTGTGFLLCFCSSCRNHSGTSHGCSELANLQKDPTVVLLLTHHRCRRLIYR